jgi:hypothetical protein
MMVKLEITGSLDIEVSYRRLRRKGWKVVDCSWEVGVEVGFVGWRVRRKNVSSVTSGLDIRGCLAPKQG